MHDELENTARELGIHHELPALREAAAYSLDRIQFARGWLQGHLGNTATHSDVVAFGSLARHEFTAASDFDYLVLSHELDPNPRGPRNLLDTVDKLRQEFAMGQAGSPKPEVRAPGSTKLFGVTLSAVDLSE